jgi:hypothetical protein
MVLSQITDRTRESRIEIPEDANNVLSRVLVTKDGILIVIGFINHLQVVTTTKYNTVTDFHTTNHSTLIFSVCFHQSPLFVSWQRIYNTLTVNKSSNHILSLHRPTSNSSTTIFPISDLRRLNSQLFWEPRYIAAVRTTQKTQLPYCW